MTAFSHRISRVKPSATLAVTAKAAELRAAGRDIIGLGAGEPDFDTPDHIKNAAIRAIQDGFTKYTAVDGTPGLKRAVAHKFSRDNHLHYEPNQILVSCGGKHSIYNLVQAIIGPGDKVVIPAPYWVSYPDIVLLAEGEPVIIPTGIDQQFKITPEQLDAALDDQVKLFFLNSPSNPTGVAYSEAELMAIGEVLRRYPDVLIATDDIYEHIIWDGPFRNIVNACPDLYERTIVLNGVSKAYSMTGWRIGYAAGPADLIKAMKKIQSQSTSNPTSISQVAAETALSGDQSFLPEMVEKFKERHDYVVDALNQLPGISCLPSHGAFYSFFNAQPAIDRLEGVADDVELSAHLIEKAEVALVPGSAFGAPGYLRLSFATSMENLRIAMERLEGVLS
ncbi:pyridoxal phosphate-dependent aminotransferase [Endothiovibrio diazotrophicus]